MAIAEPEQQKFLLNNLISEITINPHSDINKRSINQITFMFDTSLKNYNDVLTYGTVHHG
ncbi:hypothetical protein D3C78_1951130 [compost metagenome]